LLALTPAAFAADIIGQEVTGGNAVQRGEYAGVVPYEEDFVGNIINSNFFGNQVDTTGQVFQTVPDNTNIGGGAIGVSNFTGDIVNSSFRNNTVVVDSANTLHPNGGALNVSANDGYVNLGGAFVGNIRNTVFENNNMTGTSLHQWYGGAAHFADFKGEIRDSQFIGNRITPTYVPGSDLRSILTVGGAANFHVVRDSVIDNAVFRDNGFVMFGGAIRIVRASDSQINNSRFINNQGAYGGAVSLYEDSAAPTANLTFNSNVFIGNVASGAVRYGGNYHHDAYGGAIEIYNHTGHFTFNNNVFLGNLAGNDSGLIELNGWGGAIAVRTVNTGDSAFTIAANNGDRTLFYGNRHSGDSPASDTTPNAVHFGNHNALGVGYTITATMDAAAASRILMLDPLSSQADGFVYRDFFNNAPYAAGNLSAVIQKTGAGDWYLGGESNMRGASTWNIDDGSLVLTTVDYGGATGEQSAHVNLSHTGTAEFNLNANATLAGSGAISAKTIQLNGNLSPETWVNTGMRADAITTAITDAEIASIEVSKAATDGDFGELILNGDVTMSGATYHLDAHIDDSTHDRLTINGALNVANASTINIRSLTFTDPHLPDTDDQLYTVASVMTASGGITGDDLISITAGGNEHLTDADFLQVRGRKNDNGTDYDLYVGLSWRSNVLDANDEAVAHGDFTVDDLFIVNGDLHSRAQTFSGNATVHGWEGDTLTKKGEGRLILNGQNTYQGLTTVEKGELWVGDASAQTAEIAGDVEVKAGATLSGTGTILGDVMVAGTADEPGWLRGTTTVQGSITMQSGSVLSPGFSIGEMQTPHLDLKSGSTYEVEINAQGQSDRVVVRANGSGDGKAVIEPDVTLRIVNDASSTGGWKKETLYNIIDTDGGHTGQFSTIDNRLAFLDAELLYDDPLIIQLRMTRNGNPFESICETHNQCETGGGLTDLEGEDPDHAVIDAIIGLEPDEARHALDNLSGEIYGSTRSVLLEDQHLRDAVTRRTRPASVGRCVGTARQHQRQRQRNQSGRVGHGACAGHRPPVHPQPAGGRVRGV